jgi:hypothetical protein
MDAGWPKDTGDESKRTAANVANTLERRSTDFNRFAIRNINESQHGRQGWRQITLGF